jgi:hypothetical protein
MTDRERFDYLQRVAVQVFRGKELGEAERRWVAAGLLALCRGLSLNDAFQVQSIKRPNNNIHALRFFQVEKLRQQGLKKTEAMEQVAASENRSLETIKSSWKFQQSIQTKFKKLIDKAES